jgi:two-component system, NtrC family, response regulator HydG
MTRRVMIVDDDAMLRTTLAEALSDDGVSVVVAAGGVEALALLSDASPDVVLSDVRMGDVDGLALLRLLRERAPGVDVVMMTAFDDMPTVVSAMRDGAVDFLTKPIDLHQVRAVLDRVFSDRRARKQRASRADADDGPLEELVGRTPEMIQVYKLIGQAASTSATVLIRGESGTGKELVAQAIHRNARTADAPFIAVNCAALAPTLLESELFGHVRGAFTGAIASRKGRFELAGRGTIFLDEIGDTSPEFQSKLLRVLQNREYQPVGAERTELTEARVLAATHRDLESLVEARAFREDLYYRLRIVEIVIPPLRLRRPDIPLIVRHVVRRASVALGAEEPVVSDDAMERLVAHDWPGNVRELENCLMRAIVLAAGNVIRPEHLSIGSPTRRTAEAPSSSLNDVERAHVLRVLESTGGHKSRTADALRISRARLNRLLAKYGVE